MKLVSYVMAWALVFAAGSPCFAQAETAPLSSPLAPEGELHLDLAFAGVSVGVAKRVSDNTAVGASLGVGGNWLNYMALGGRHFAEPGGLSYEAKDGYTSKSLLEGVRGSLFVRRHFGGGRELDLGLKASLFLHSDSSDDDFGGGSFVGANVTYTWLQWRKLHFGSELDIGRYSEGTPELGVNVAPLMVRVAF